MSYNHIFLEMKLWINTTRLIYIFVFVFSGKSTPTPEKDKADKVAEGQSSDSSRERKSSSWWPFGGKKPEDSDALSSTPSKIETAEDAAEKLLSEVVVNVENVTGTYIIIFSI